MSIQLTESVKKMLAETALKLKGAFKRRFQAQTVLELGHGGSLLAQKVFIGTGVLLEKELKN